MNALLTAAMVVAITCGCGVQTTEVKEQQAVETVTVQTSLPVTGVLNRSTQFVGTVQPDTLVAVLPKIPGTVSEVLVKVGDEVKAGDLLFTIDTKDVELSLAAQRAGIAAAQAAVNAAQAQVDQQMGSGYDLQMAQLETQLQSAQNQYAAARKGLQDYYDGKESMVDEMISQRDMLRDTMPLLQTQVEDAAAAELQARAALGLDPQNPQLQKAVEGAAMQSVMAQEKLKAAQTNEATLTSNINGADDEDAQGAQLRTAVRNAQLAYESANTVYELTDTDMRQAAQKVANAQLQSAQAQLQVQQASYNAAAVQLEYANVTAPIEGVIEAVNVTENGVVGNTSMAMAITDKNSISAVFFVSEEAVGQISKGDDVTVTVNKDVYEGVITEAGTMVDQSTGLFKMKCQIKNAGFIMTGISATIDVVTAKAQNALMIPLSALYHEDGQGYVYVNQKGYARKMNVETGVSDNEQVQILSGLTADMQVITTWNPNLRDGIALVTEGGT